MNKKILAGILALGIGFLPKNYVGADDKKISQNISGMALSTTQVKKDNIVTTNVQYFNLDLKLGKLSVTTDQNFLRGDNLRDDNSSLSVGYIFNGNNVKITGEHTDTHGNKSNNIGLETRLRPSKKFTVIGDVSTFGPGNRYDFGLGSIFSLNSNHHILGMYSNRGKNNRSKVRLAYEFTGSNYFAFATDAREKNTPLFKTLFATENNRGQIQFDPDEGSIFTEAILTYGLKMPSYATKGSGIGTSFYSAQLIEKDPSIRDGDFKHFFPASSFTGLEQGRDVGLIARYFGNWKPDEFSGFTDIGMVVDPSIITGPNHGVLILNSRINYSGNKITPEFGIGYELKQLDFVEKVNLNAGASPQGKWRIDVLVKY